MSPETANIAATPPVEIAQLIAAMRGEVARDRSSLRFRIARPPGSPWLEGRRRRGRRARSGSIPLQFDVRLKDLLALDGAEFIQETFIKLLGRRADPTGLETYLAQLTGGKSRKVRVIQSLRNSEEGRARAVLVRGLGFAIWWNNRFSYDISVADILHYDGSEFVVKAYTALLGRPPDAEGFRLRLPQARRGRSGKIEMLREFCESAEGRERGARVRGLSFAIWRDRRFPYDISVTEIMRQDGSDFVVKAYMAILGRPPDAEGHELRLAQAGQGRRGKIEVIRELHASAEGRARDARVHGLAFAIATESLYHGAARLRRIIGRRSAAAHRSTIVVPTRRPEA